MGVWGDKEMNIHFIDPCSIKNFSSISGCPQRRLATIQQQRELTRTENKLNGDWDLVNHPITETCFLKDFETFKNGKIPEYPWHSLYWSVSTSGYIQKINERYIEVNVSRKGEYLLSDGRHRLLCAQHFGIRHIPVNIIFMHPSYILPTKQLSPMRCYKDFSKDWKGEIYQVPEQIENRFDLASNYLHILKDKKVFELGCNAGMSIPYIMQHATQYIGYEPNTIFFNQCQQTVSRLNNPKVQFFNKSFTEFPDDFDAFFGSNILYWLSDSEIELLKKFLTQCSTVVLLVRAKDRTRLCNKYFLNRQDYAIRFLINLGFKTCTIDVPLTKDKSHYTGGYFLLIGEK